MPFCPDCGAELYSTTKFCPECGSQVYGLGQVPRGRITTRAPIDRESVPPGVTGWSWGAFFLSLIWGLFNRVWISLLMLVPFVNWVMMFVLAIKGKEWAWKAGNWRSVRHFRRTQHNWSIAGWIYFLIIVLLYILSFIMIMEGY